MSRKRNGFIIRGEKEEKKTVNSDLSQENNHGGEITK